VSELLLGLAGVRAEVRAPAELGDRLRAAVTGPALLAPDGAVDVAYEIIDEGAGRYGLERNRGGLLRDADPEVVIDKLTADVVAIVHRRRPGVVIVRAGVVVVAGRAIVILGPDDAGTSTLVAEMVAAGGERYADGPVVIDADGRVAATITGPAPPGAPVGSVPSAPVVLIVETAFEAGIDWAPAEVTGARAVLGLLRHLVGIGGTSPAARALARRLAEQVVELRGPRPDARSVAVDLLERAGAIPLPARTHTPTTEVDHEEAEPEPAAAPFVQIDDFLDEGGHARLLEFVRSRRDDFVPSSVTKPDEGAGATHADLRRSRTLYDLDEVWDLFEAPIARLLPHVRRELGVPWFALDRIERQLNVHGGRDHFTLHTDSGGPDTSSRVVSAVYYFNREPRRFSGGELWLFDTVERGGTIEAVAGHTEIEPCDNRLVFFRSDAFHEVRPVRLRSDDFADLRFTVVFWARQATPVAALFSGDPDTLTARQQQLVPALTADGFRVVPTPAAVQERLHQLFVENRDRATPEHSDSNYLPSGDPSMIPFGETGDEILAELKPLHEEWCGGELVPSAAYGIRVYGEGQTLHRHCDRVETHVISSVVHIAADTDEPWPLTLEDADGKVHEVVLAPGEMVFYESARMPHARPTPLRGRHYASCFLHYRPTDWAATLELACREETGPGGRLVHS
jgi:Rps23 Pro-64 3,4-dihydroxylase Tpa1-like proline 4-hydroxylase